MSYLDDYKKGLEKRRANLGSTRDSTASNQGDKTVAERSDDYMGGYLRGLERRNDRPVYSSGVGQNYLTNFMKRSNEILSGIKSGTYRTNMQELQELGQQSSAIRKFLHDNPSEFPREIVRILEDRMNELDSATRSTSWAVRTDMLDEARAGMESSQGKSRYQENQEAMAEESARLRKKWEGSLNPYLYGPGGYQPNEHYNMVGQEQAKDYFDLSSMAQEKVWMDTVAKYTGKEFKDNFFGQFGANYTMGRLGQDSSIAWNKYLDDPTEQNRRDAETIDQLITEMQLNNEDTLADDGTLPWISKTLANYIPQFLDQMKYSGSLGAVGALTGNPKGVKAGMVMGSGVYSYMTMRGAVFKSLLEAGIPEEQARAAAKDEAVVSSLIEMGDTAIDLATLGGGKLINVLTAGSLDAIKNQIAKGVGKNVLTKLAAALAKYGINIGSEWLEEATQESVSIANQNNPGGEIPGLVQDAAGVFFGSVLDPESAEGQQIREAGEEGAKIAAMMGGIQGVTNAAAARVSTNYQAKQAYGPYSQELIQEAKILNPDSQLAEKLQGQIDSKKDLSGRQIVNMVRENQNAFEKQVNPETTLEEASQKYGSQAKAMESIYRMGNGKQEIGKFDAAYKLAYDMGKNDVRLEYVMQSPSTQYLTETQRAFAYQTGQFAAKNQEQTSNVDANQVAQTKQTRDNETKQAAAENAGDGKTILSKTGEEVKVKEIASNESGKQTLLLEDGRTVDASDVSFGSSGEALVYETVAQMGVDAKSANTLVRNYVPGQGITAQEYSQQIQDAYRFGKLNFPETELAVSAQTNKLTQQQRMEAYRQGKKAGELETDTAETSAREKKKAAPKEKGKVHFDGDRSKLTKAQKVGLTALDKVADNLNLQVYIFESEVDENGNRIGANGWYDSKDNSIHIDLHAGMDGKGTILFTAAHELTHHIKELSPEKFRALADFLNQEYGKRGVSIDDLVTGQIEKSARAGVELTYDEAYEEMVADSMETMLSDGKVLEKLEKLKTSERSLWETIREYIADLAAKIRQVYSRLLPDSAEGRYVAQMRDSIEKLQDLFVEGLADASANYQTKTSGTEVVMDGENLKYQTRSFQDQVDELIEGKIPSDSAVYVGKTPSILAEIGFDGNLPMLVTQKHIKDAIAPKNDEMHHHGLTVDQVKSIPDKLKSPVMLIDSFKSGSNTVLAVIDEVDPDGCPVVVAIKADGSGRFNGILVDSNFITSMYGRERFVKFLERCIKWNKLLYVDQKKSQSLSISSSVQFAEQLKGISSNVIIRKSDVIVNEKNNPARDFYGRNLDNTSPGDKVKFSMRSSVEETKNLVALHNLTEGKLLKALDLGGFPMPSIAITKADIPHTNFGEISLVMKKETIDPQVNKKNTVYSADAWTPVFPVIEYDINEKAASKVSKKLRSLEEKVDDEFRDSILKAVSSYREYVSEGGTEYAVSMLRDDYGLKAAYLEENGIHIDRIEKRVEQDPGYQEGRVEKYRAITEVLGTTDPDGIRKMSMKEIRDSYGSELEKVSPGMTRTAIRMSSILRQTASWLENQGKGKSYKTIADIEAMRNNVDGSVVQSEFESWLTELLSDVQGERGARNGKTAFTAAGNARTFKQTHVPVTLENITKVMANENGGNSKNVSSFVGVKSLRAGMAERFSGIADMHKAEGRLQNLSEEEAKSVTDNLGDRMYNLMERIYGLRKHSRYENKYMTMDSIGEILMEITNQKHITSDSIANKFQEYGYKLNGSTAFDVRDLLFDVSQMPVNIFEAKPERAVRFDEVLAAIVPIGTSDAVKNRLSENGVEVLEYRKDDTADRLEKVNSVEGAKFQQRERRPETVVQMLQDQNAKLREDLKDAREMVKLQGQVTGGKLLRQSSIESAARHLKQKWDIGGNTKELAALLKPFYDHILNGEEVSWETVRENAQPVVDFMIQNEKTHMDSYAESVLSSLNGRKIRLNERQRAEVESAFGSVRDFQNAISGTVKLSNDGMPLDSFFAEMNAEFPDQFPADLNDADMPAALAGIVDTMRSMDKPNTFGMDPMVIEQDMVRDVYDSYWRVSTLYTVADKYNRQIQDMKGKQAQKVDALRERKDQEIDRKIANLKKAHDERIQKIRADQRERIANLREEQKQVLERTRDKYRKRLNEQHEELTKKYTESRKKAIQSRKKTHMRNRIRSVVKDIDAILNHGTKERNVKEGLKDTVYKSLRLAEVLFGDMRPETILKGDIQSVTKEEKENLERYRNLLKQRNEAKDRLDNLNKDTVDSAEAWNAANPEREQLEMTLLETRKELSKLRDKLQEVVEREKNRLMAQGSVSQAIDALAEEYQSLQDSTEAGLQWAYDEEVHNRILQLKDDLKNAVIDEMSLQQLEDVHDLYTMVLTTIRNANKAFRGEKGETITNIASEVMSQLGSQKSQPELQTKAAEGINRFRWNNLKPVYAFERIGSPTFAKLFNRVRSGEDTWAVDVTEARDFFREQAKKYNFDSWDFDTTHTFESASGSQFSLSLQQIMSLYAFSKREQALDHLRRGGIVIDSTTEVTKKTALGINRKFNPTKATSYNIKDATLADIVSKLTDEQKAFADAMQDYLSTTMGAKGNEVSMELYGIKMFKEKNYFPLRSATQFMAKAKEQQMVDPKIKNKGFTKETVRKASNPIVLTPFMNVWAGHVNEMSMYHAFTLPMEDFYRVYSFKTPTSEKTAMKSVEMLLQNAHGKAATAYIDQLLRDLNGGVRADASAGIINKSIGMFKKGAVFASMSVVVQQPSAIARAAALIDTKYFIGPKVDSKRHAALWDEVKKYAPIAIIKEMGYFDTNMGLSTYDFITSKEYSGFREKMKAVVSDSNYRDEILSKAPALADELAWCGIWEAVKRETAANNESLNRNSEEFLRKCGERFTEVIVKTQVYDSVLARSALMRSKDTGVKMATAFMAEPTTSINMIEDALIKGKNGNRKYARKAIGSVIASVILNSILVSFVYAGRDDDDEKTYVEKYLGSLTGSIIDSMNPGTYIPFIRDIVSIVQGYDVERSDMTVVSDIWNAWKKMGRDDLPPYRKVEDFVGSISQIFGLPVKNIMRDARGIYNTINSFLGGKKTTWTGVRYAVQENLPGIIGGKEASRQNRLYTAIVNGDASYVERMKGSYKDESSYNSAVRAALRSNDSRIQEAATARLNGDLNTYTTIAKKIIKEGHFDQDTVVLAISAEVNAMDGEESTSSTTKAQSLYDADDFTTAIIQDDQDMAATIQQEIIRVAELNGKTNEEAADSFARSAESALKEEFLTWNIGKSQAVNAITKYCDEEKENAEETVDGWQFEQEWGFAYSQRKSAYKSGQITSSELRTILMDMGGKTAEEAEQDIACYDWEMEVPGSEGISYAAIRDYHASVEPYGVTKETYTQAWKIKNAAKGVDADGDGKKDAYSVVQEVFPQIAALPISAEQKDALAHCWWADSTVKKYKTW